MFKDIYWDSGPLFVTLTYIISLVTGRNKMDKDQQEQKRFLEQQLQWSKERARILEEIEKRLHEMKEIAEYTLKHELTTDEIERLNGQLNDLQGAVHSLESQLHDVVH
jgi:Tfp pilus assembly protein PilO